MNLKLDENLGGQTTDILRRDGHDVTTIYEQKLTGADDHRLIEVCRIEKRRLVSLDLDFANPLVFDPSNYFGIAVLRLSRKPSYQVLIKTVETLSLALKKENIIGALWIVEQGRIRIHKSSSE